MRGQPKSITSLFLVILMALSLLGAPQSVSAATVRLKDIAHIKGVRDNQLLGYGFVVGLSKTGDKSRSTQYSAKNLLLNFGTVVENPNDIKSNNSAAVMITATVPAFAKAGDKIDVIVSSVADAQSLEGGVLIQTQLQAANGEVVAVAQGPISTGGSSAESGGSSKRTSITTSGRIPNGAIIERDMLTQMGDDYGVDVILNRADFSLAQQVAERISGSVAPASAIDGGDIRVDLPAAYPGSKVKILSAIENLLVQTVEDQAKVIINERTGTIVIGNAVRLSPAAVAHGGITVSIESTNTVSQPNALTGNGAQTLGVTNSKIDIDKSTGSLIQLKANQTLQDLVVALNAIGVTPSDLISILQALKMAGSLQAELEII
jgi:flagellar P-ring protein FlgI